MGENANISSKDDESTVSIGPIQLSPEKEKGFIENIRKQTKKHFTGLFKDIEITKIQFITLLLLLLSFATVLMIDIILTIEIGTQTIISGGLEMPENLIPGVVIGFGIVIGFIVGGFLLDRTKGKRYPAIFTLILISIGITFNHILFFRRTGDIIPTILFLVSSFVAGMIFMIFLTSFIDFTTILERGRIFSFLMILLAFCLSIIIFLVYIGVIFLPLIILVISFTFFFMTRERERPYEPYQKEGSKREINFSILKYLLILVFYCFAVGLFIPSQQIRQIGDTGWSTLFLGIFLIGGIIISVSTAIFLGLIFDFSGRKASLSYMILAISGVNFFRIFNIEALYFDLIIMLATILSSFMCVPLFMSDFVERENLGKILGITFSAVLISMVLGFYVESIISSFISELFIRIGASQPYAEYTSEIALLGIVNFASIISLFFLVNSKEAVSSKEQNWNDYLIHLYLIHESGILVYEYSFVDEKDLIESDLASGGLTGLIAILKEITKEEESLKSIDHGGKRIMFLFHGSLVLALISTEELLILRNKLYNFMQELERRYNINEEEFNGVDVGLWRKRLDPILEKHFKIKYFEFISDFYEF